MDDNEQNKKNYANDIKNSIIKDTTKGFNIVIDPCGWCNNGNNDEICDKKCTYESEWELNENYLIVKTESLNNLISGFTQRIEELESIIQQAKNRLAVKSDAFCYEIYLLLREAFPNEKPVKVLDKEEV